MSHRHKKDDKDSGRQDAPPLGADASDHKKEAAAQAAAPSAQGQQAGGADDRLIRLQADFENFRKRVIKERAELFKRANEDLMLEVLPVIDNMERAIGSAAAHGVPQVFADGVRSVYDQLLTVLARFGLESIDTVGKIFDPNEHEAIAHIPSETVQENGIIEQARRGYRLGGRLLRAAQVVVSSGKKAPAEAPQASADGGISK